MASETQEIRHLREAAAEGHAQHHARSWAVWFGVFGGPVAWGAHHLVTYMLAAWFLCDVGGRWALVGATLLAGAIAVAATVAAWRGWARTRKDTDADLHGTGGSDGFLGFLGVSLGLLSLVGILYNGLTIFFFDPCG